LLKARSSMAAWLGLSLSLRTKPLCSPIPSLFPPLVIGGSAGRHLQDGQNRSAAGR
jgi:hypothetical protein